MFSAVYYACITFVRSGDLYHFCCAHFYSAHLTVEAREVFIVIIIIISIIVIIIDMGTISIMYYVLLLLFDSITIIIVIVARARVGEEEGLGKGRRRSGKTDEGMEWGKRPSPEREREG